MSRRRRAHNSRRPHQHESARRHAHRTLPASDPAAQNPLIPMLRPALQDADVTAFWVTAAPLVPMLAEDPGDLPEGIDLLQTFIDVNIAESTALLHVIAAISPDDGFRRRAREAVAARRQPMPPQVAGLSEATIGDTTVFSDTQGDNLMVELVLPKTVRAVLIAYIARDPLPYVKDAFLVGAPLRQVHADYRRIMAQDGFSLDDVLEVLSPEQAGAALTDALDATPDTVEDPEGGGEQWPMIRPFIEFIRELLPADGAGYDEDGWLAGSEHRASLEDAEPHGDEFDPDLGTPPWVLEDGTDLLEAFLASEHAREVDHGDSTARLVMFLLLVASGATGDPLGWTDELGAWVAEEMLPTNPVLSRAAIDQVPSVMPDQIRWAHARTGIDPSRTDATLDVVRLLLEELPARYADPRNRALRLEAHVDIALESREPGELRYADLAMRVGGYEELSSLELGPLPTERLLLDGVPEDLHDRLREIDAHLVTGLDRLSSELDLDAALFGDEVLTACRRLATRIARTDPAALRRRASTRITAGAIAWTIGRGNELLGHPPAPVRSQDLLTAFDLKSSPSQRADTLMRAAALPRSGVGVALGDAELLVSSARQEILRIRAVLDGVQPEW